MKRVFRLSLGALIVLVLAPGTSWAQATAQITIEAGAALGPRTVQVKTGAQAASKARRNPIDHSPERDSGAL